MKHYLNYFVYKLLLFHIFWARHNPSPLRASPLNTSVPHGGIFLRKIILSFIDRICYTKYSDFTYHPLSF